MRAVPYGQVVGAVMQALRFQSSVRLADLVPLPRRTVMGTEDITSLEGIWPLQAALNRRAGVDTHALGLAVSSVADGSRSDIEGDILLKAGRGLKNYIDAMMAECHELQECLSWKHWYKEAKEGRQYELRDIQNARVEATDMLFFWISICQLLGMEPPDVYRLYSTKLAINTKRQEENRTQAEHLRHEDENREVL